MKPPLYFENPNKPKKKLSPQEWDQQNASLGYSAVPNEKGMYKHYYDPKSYVLNNDGSFVKASDVNNPNINYNNDSSYQPLIKYTPPADEIAPKRITQEANSGRKATDFQYAPQGYIGYKYDDGTIKYLNDKGDDLQNLTKPTEITQMKTGGLVKKVKGYFTGGDVDPNQASYDRDYAARMAETDPKKPKPGALTRDQKITGLNLAGQGLNSIGGQQDTNMQYGTNSYFDNRNQSLQQGQGVANAVGAIPIVGAFKSIGEGAQNAIAKKDAYGVSNSSDAAIAAGGFLNPLESTTSAFNDIKGGKFTGKTAANLLAPGLGAVLNNRENKKQRDLAQAGQLTENNRQQAIFNQKSNLATALADRQSGYKNGGQIEGKGTGKSDSIKAKVEKGSFIVPSENAEAAEEIREKVLKAQPMKKANLKQAKGEEVMLSNGEHLFTPEEKNEILANGINLDDLAPDAQNKLRDHLNKGGEVKGYKTGGNTGDNPKFSLSEENRKKMVADSKESDLKTKKELQQELLQLKKQSDSGDPLAKGIFMKRGAEISAQINRINEKHGILPSNIPSNSGANIERAMGYPGKTKVPKMAKPVTPEEVANAIDNKYAFSKDYAALENPSLTPPNETTPVSETGLAGKVNGANPNQERFDKDYATALAENPPTNTGISDTGKGLSKGLGLAVDYGLPLIQAGIGLNYLNKSGKRPLDQIDPDYLAGIATSKGIVERANNNARFGYTPEEQAYLDNQNNNITQAQKYAARDLSGGSASNAYTLERNALNDSYGRGLQAKLGGRQLQLQKQNYADAKQNDLNNLLADKANRSRMLFGDTLNAWQQNQQAGGTLLGTGLSNLIGANRYRNELDSTTQRNNMYNPQYPTV